MDADQDDKKDDEGVDLEALLAGTDAAEQARPQARAVFSASSRMALGDDGDETTKKKRKVTAKDKQLALEDPPMLAEEDGDSQTGKTVAAEMKHLKEEDPDMFEVATKHADLSRTSGKINLWWQLRVENAFCDKWDGRLLTAAGFLFKELHQSAILAASC